MEDIKVNMINVRDKAMTVSTIRAKWVMKYFSEKRQLEKLKIAKKNLIDNEIEKLQSTNISTRTMSKVRLIEEVSRNSDNLIKLNLLITQQSEIIQFMEYALNIVADFNFTVKHALDAIKLEQA